jgi:hypothetical protein
MTDIHAHPIFAAQVVVSALHVMLALSPGQYHAVGEQVCHWGGRAGQPSPSSSGSRVATQNKTCEAESERQSRGHTVPIHSSLGRRNTVSAPYVMAAPCIVR